jgi:hypothetical protein
MVELYLHAPVCLHGIELNELRTGELYLSFKTYTKTTLNK